MSFTKGSLSKLNRELIKYNIKSESIAEAAKEKDKTTELIRLVLKGEAPDKNNIIDFLTDCVIKEKKKISKVSEKIDTL